MSNSGMVILLLAVAFFTVMGLSATSNLWWCEIIKWFKRIAERPGSKLDYEPIFTVFIICIVLISSYALIHAFSSMWVGGNWN